MACEDYEYSFGHLRWQGKSYRKDVIIYGETVLCPWKREHGHRLSFGDFKELMSHPPRILVIGTGQLGVMDVPDDVLEKLAQQGVDGRPMPTEKALKHFVELRAQGKDVAAALHLTC